jgi:hypothetical protein
LAPQKNTTPDAPMTVEEQRLARALIKCQFRNRISQRSVLSVPCDYCPCSALSFAECSAPSFVASRLSVSRLSAEIHSKYPSWAAWPSLSGSSSVPGLARAGRGRVARGVRLGRKPKLTAHQRQEALHRCENGELVREIARSYNVSHSTISRLVP